MAKILAILIAQVKYPSSNSAYLTANSYVVEKDNFSDLENAVNDFKKNIETDDFKIINFLIHTVPQGQIKEFIK